MSVRGSLSIGEWYHCYSRGVDKRVVFENKEEYDRFLAHLYVGNATKAVHLSDFKHHQIVTLYSNDTLQRGEALVELGAYALMPNHVHFIIREIREGGIALFMQKVFTGYTLYFNKKYGRTGALFSGTFKSKHLGDDRYLKQAIPYVLLNVMELIDAKWKNGTTQHDLEKKILEYPYSSLPEFCAVERIENKIINGNLHQYYDKVPSLSEMIREAQEYYQKSIREVKPPEAGSDFHWEV
jgi:REP element-mobilizing transposase RayT